MKTLRLEKASAKTKELGMIVTWRNQNLQYFDTSVPYTLSGMLEWLDNLKDELHFFVFLDDRLIGSCGLSKINPTDQTAKVNILIRNERRGKGLGRETMRQLLNIAFFKLDLNLVTVHCFAIPRSPWLFFSKIGFKREAALRNRKLWNDKRYKAVIGSIQKDEWEMICLTKKVKKNLPSALKNVNSS